MYAKKLTELNHVLKNKNALLKLIKKDHAKIKELGFWNNQVKELASDIILKRLIIISSLSKKIKETYNEISNKNQIFSIDYKNDASGKEKVEDIKKELENKLEQKRDFEVLYGKSLIGPQKDDLVFRLDGFKMDVYASRGEARTAVLTLKLAEIDYLIEVDPKNPPIILLDDPFSELDLQRSENFLKMLDKTNQLFITSTDFKEIDIFKEKSNIIKI